MGRQTPQVGPGKAIESKEPDLLHPGDPSNTVLCKSPYETSALLHKRTFKLVLHLLLLFAHSGALNGFLSSAPRLQQFVYLINQLHAAAGFAAIGISKERQRWLRYRPNQDRKSVV